MKLIFENWRRFLNENSNISESTERLLSILINLKKFKSVEDFISRTKLLIDGRSNGFVFNLLIDDKIAGIVTYRTLKKNENCRPDPYKDNTTYMLKNIARDGSFKGFGVGRLIAFLSACYISDIGGSITSDRNTSDKAGEQLVDSLKMVGAQQSDEFDYVGFFVNQLRDTYLDSEGNFKSRSGDHIRPTSNKTFNRDSHNTRLKTQFDLEFPELIKKVINHLKPLTPEKDDDCAPSDNIIMIDNVDFYTILNNKNLPSFLEKTLTMSSEELQQFFNSDDRVQGYTFVLPDMMIDAALEIMNSINASHEYSDDERYRITKSSLEMFKNVYNNEIDSGGRTRTTNKLHTTARAASELGALKEEKNEILYHRK